MFLVSAIPNLDSLRWQNRVMVVFSSEKNDHRLKDQERIADSYAQGFGERDIRVFTVVGEGAEAQSLRNKLHVAADIPFAVVLIGKDGSAKLHKVSVLSAEELFQTIDKMPMRQAEMKRR